MKKIFVYLTILLLLISTAGPVVIFADDATNSAAIPTIITPTPTTSPTPTPAITVDSTSSATVSTDVTSTSNSGDNAIQAASDSADITPTPSEDPDATQSADTTSLTDETTATGSSSITTGDSVTTTNVQNSTNTTTNDSRIIYQTINIFLNSNDTIDLSSPVQVAEDIASQSNASNSANVLMNSTTNYATVNNDIVSTADSGNNTANTSGDVIINTGNAYSLVSLLNTVNVTLTDSIIHIVTINIYGNLNGNIILPDLNGTTTCTSCSITLNAQNTADITNTVNSQAVTGQNTINGANGSSITTGDATSAVNITSIVNTILVNELLGQVSINNFGTWNGTYVGNDATQQVGDSLILNSLPQATQDNTAATNDSIQNTADVTNNITSLANTGENTTTGGKGTIVTGNAYSFVSITNLVNAIFNHTTGFFGFVNIFGHWQGNIGEASAFITPTPSLTPTDNQNTQNNTPSNQQETGGQLSIAQSNNVGKYVLPGDTVTFFINGANIGSGKVYGTSVNLTLYHNGVNVGGEDFPIGDIPVGVKYNLSTGLVLSQDADGGDYTAVATITGVTGPDNTAVSASANSTFTIYNPGVLLGNKKDSQTNQPQVPSVLGVHTTVPSPENDSLLLLILFATMGSYLTLRMCLKRKQLSLLLKDSLPTKIKIASLMHLLLL
ncbi:MAG TPA: hypothetical protein VN711_02825 [Candidatus Saccharimonadales bacterium]|nr:hypothetical protein [Candidatus Saccharimonadales bacterium]